ncbi:MAG: hypothetical protein ABF381_10695 [Akkermansiaceae bacterium]
METYAKLDTLLPQVDFPTQDFCFGEVGSGYRVKGRDNIISILEWHTVDMKKPAEEA